MKKRKHGTDAITIGSNFWHISENRPQNPENLKIPNCCKIRASWWISMNPMPNGSSRMKFFNFFGILNFRSFLHVLQHFGDQPYPEFRKWWKIPNMLCAVITFLLKILIFFKIWKSNFFQLAESYKVVRQIFNTKCRSRDKIRNVEPDFRFSGFPYINLLRKYFLKDFIKDFW